MRVESVHWFGNSWKKKLELWERKGFVSNVEVSEYKLNYDCKFKLLVLLLVAKDRLDDNDILIMSDEEQEKREVDSVTLNMTMNQNCKSINFHKKSANFDEVIKLTLDLKREFAKSRVQLVKSDDQKGNQHILGFN